MDLRPQAGPQSGFQHLGGIFHREEALFAEDVHEVGIARRIGHHAADRRHVLFVRVAAAYGMRPQEGAADQGGRGRPDAVDDPQHLQFVDRVEPVAALDLDGPRALCDHFVHPLHGLPEELVFGGPVQQVGRIEDAAAAGRDLPVGETADLVEEFPVAAAGVDDMRVAVAESRHQQSAFAVDGLVGELRQGFGGAAEGDDLPVVDEEPGVGQRVDLVHGRAFLAPDMGGYDARQRADVAKQPSHNAKCIGFPG